MDEPERTSLLFPMAVVVVFEGGLCLRKVVLPLPELLVAMFPVVFIPVAMV